MGARVVLAAVVLLWIAGGAGAAPDESEATWLTGFHRMRAEQIEASRACDRALLEWHRADDEESAAGAFGKCRSAAEALLPVLEVQMAAVGKLEVPAGCEALHEIHRRILEDGVKRLRRFLEEELRPVVEDVVFCPTGFPEQQRRLHEELAKLLETEETEAEREAGGRIEKEIVRSREIDRPALKASRLWNRAKTLPERREALLSFFRAHRGMEAPLLGQYEDLCELSVPARHRDLLAALREAVRLEIMVCRRVPEGFLVGDNRWIGLWTSVQNDVLNMKARMAGVNLFDELRGETEDR